MKETSLVKKALKESRFFKDFDEETIADIAALGRLVTLEAGAYVFKQGDFGKDIYIIVRGHVSLERSTDLGNRPGKVVVDLLSKGRFLGCWSTLLGEPHILMSSAYCRKPTKLVSIDGGQLREIMLKNTELGLQVIERLCFLLRDRIQAAYGAMEKI